MTETPATASETPEASGPSDPSAFKKKKQGQLLALPSGLTCRARRVELRTFVKQGNVPNALMSVVEEALSKGGQLDLEQVVGQDGDKVDMKALEEMYEMVDTVVCTVVMEPQVVRVPTAADLSVWNAKHPEQEFTDPDELRKDDIVYVDEIDDEDKMFLFQWSSGGTADLATFREEAAAAMGTVASLQGSGGTPQ